MEELPILMDHILQSNRNIKDGNVNVIPENFD